MTEEQIEQKADDFYFKKYTRTLNVGEEERQKAITEAYIAGAIENGIEWHDVRHAQTEEEFPSDNENKLYVWKVDCRKYEKDKSDIKYHIGTQVDLMYEVYTCRVMAWCEMVKFEE